MTLGCHVPIVACTAKRKAIVGHLLERYGLPADAVPAIHADYRALCGMLDKLAPECLRGVACIVDLHQVLQGWEMLLDVHPMRPTMLAWRYPEVYWIFLVPTAESLPAALPPMARAMHFASLPDAQAVRMLLARHRGGMRTWFDPWELRRSALYGAGLPSRPHPVQGDHLGVVLDEEAEYALFNGYLLYRRNLPVCLVATYDEFAIIGDQLVGDPRQLVVLEDVELNYADAASKLHLIPSREQALLVMLDERTVFLGMNAKPPVAHRYVSATISPKVDRYRPGTVLKPLAGLDDPGILAALDTVRTPAWPSVPQGSDHSAPGKCQDVAVSLLMRARVLDQSATDTTTALHGALLAFEAERLLADRTYTMTMESLALRHGFEAITECVFSGATDELTVAPRVCGLRHKVTRLVFHADRICVACVQLAVYGQLVASPRSFLLRWTKLHKRRVQLVNGMLEVLSKLRDVYSRYRKAEEEEHVLHAVRLWRVRLFQLKRPVSNRLARRQGGAALLACQLLEGAWRSMLALPLYYVSHILRPGALSAAVLCWILLFAGGYHHLASDSRLATAPSSCNGAHWVRHSAVTFLAMQAGTFGDPKEPSGGCAQTIRYEARGYDVFWRLTLAEMAIGYFHLGLLVAVLVQRITRR